jgi:hypothetical protein
MDLIFENFSLLSLYLGIKQADEKVNDSLLRVGTVPPEQPVKKFRPKMKAQETPQHPPDNFEEYQAPDNWGDTSFQNEVGNVPENISFPADLSHSTMKRKGGLEDITNKSFEGKMQPKSKKIASADESSKIKIKNVKGTVVNTAKETTLESITVKEVFLSKENNPNLNLEDIENWISKQKPPPQKKTESTPLKEQDHEVIHYSPILFRS